MNRTGKLPNPILHYGLMLLIYGVGAMTLFSHTLFHGGHDHVEALASVPAASVAACEHTGRTYYVDIRNSHASPRTTRANLCDKLTFINHDNVTREMAFGPHENHVPYDGVAERILGRNQSFTITLDQAGSFHYHDHAHDEVEGYFTIQNQ